MLETMNISTLRQTQFRAILKTSKLIFALCLITVNSSFAQTDLFLNFEHTYEAAPFNYGTIYTTENGSAIRFNRVQYYLSGFEITHDGGIVTSLPDAYVLASGNVSNYSIGNEAVTSMQGINFDLGVDSLRNHMGTSSWPAQHPLAAKSPPMDWAWPSGYFFVAFEGEIDDNGDGIPNKLFQLFGIGDTLLTSVTPFYGGIESGGASITIPFNVNVADWIKNMDLTIGGVEHGSGVLNTQLAENTNGEEVFTLIPLVGLEDLDLKESHVYANYTLPYAPTLFYNLATKQNVDIRIFDLNGSLVLESLNEEHEGNFFVRKELRSGNYIAVFSNNEIEESFRFIVQQ
ncbi:MAG: hypothetical protein ACJA1C_001251 [Crocinitomicaceae bacterium]|jgi:hypothetical protein